MAEKCINTHADSTQTVNYRPTHRLSNSVDQGDDSREPWAKWHFLCKHLTPISCWRENNSWERGDRVVNHPVLTFPVWAGEQRVGHYSIICKKRETETAASSCKSPLGYCGSLPTDVTQRPACMWTSQSWCINVQKIRFVFFSWLSRQQEEAEMVLEVLGNPILTAHAFLTTPKLTTCPPDQWMKSHFGA